MLSVDMSPVQWTDRPPPDLTAGRIDPIWGAGGRRFKSGQSRPKAQLTTCALGCQDGFQDDDPAFVLGQAKQLSTAGGAVALHPAPGSSSDSSAL
jgi:hypothetical protein